MARRSCRSRFWTDPIAVYKLVVAYDGSGFAGSQRQPDRRTVQAELEAAWRSVTGEADTMTLAGRTDAGVHAEGQVASVRSSAKLTEQELLRGLADALPAGLRVRALTEVGPDFDARRDARWRLYRYRLPGDSSYLGRAYVDAGLVSLAADHLLGEKDFSAVSSAMELGPRGAVRRMFRAPCVVDRTGGVTFVFVADAFLRQMVRRMVAALVAVGTGKIGVRELTRALELRDRALLPGPAPAQHLTLVEVGYGDYR